MWRSSYRSQKSTCHVFAPKLFPPVRPNSQKDLSIHYKTAIRTIGRTNHVFPLFACFRLRQKLTKNFHKTFGGGSEGTKPPNVSYHNVINKARRSSSLRRENSLVIDPHQPKSLVLEKLRENIGKYTTGLPNLMEPILRLPFNCYYYNIFLIFSGDK